ncbi:MAG: hypothetical protein WAP35_00050 [Solirubrobacterales bacterium]
MGVLAVKLALAPALVVGASLITRRFGPRLGGLAAALPAVAGPVLLVFALDHGAAFAADAAAAALLGVVALTVFIVTFSRVAYRFGWASSLAIGWFACGVTAVALAQVDLPREAALGAAYASIVAAMLLLPTPGHAASPAEPPRWDLPMRALATIALVVALTALAGELGSTVSGVFTPFPVIAAILAAFTHGQSDPDTVVRVMRGLLGGLFAFAGFFYVLALALAGSGEIAQSFAIALTAGLAIQLLALLATHRADRGQAMQKATR